jgi:hypothetical protein
VEESDFHRLAAIVVLLPKVFNHSPRKRLATGLRPVWPTARKGASAAFADTQENHKSLMLFLAVVVAAGIAGGAG